MVAVTDQPEEQNSLVLGGIFAIIVLVVVAVWWIAQPKEEKDDKHKKKSTSKKDHHQQQKDAAAAAAAAAKSKEAKQSKHARHPNLLCTFMGHRSPVLDYAVTWDNATLATTSEDRTVMLWNLQKFTNPPKAPLRLETEFDHASHLAFSANGKAVGMIFSRAKTIAIQFLQFGGEKGGKVTGVTHKQSPHGHKGEIIALQWAKGGHFLVSCTADTEIKVWSTDCQLVEAVSSYASANYGVGIALDYPLFAVATFMPEVKVWEVLMGKDGAPQKTHKVFALTGKSAQGYRPHTKPVHAVAWGGPASKQMLATASMDGTWKVWSTSRRSDSWDEPQVVYSSPSRKCQFEKIALSPDSKIVAVYGTEGLQFFSVDGHELLSIPPRDIGTILKMSFLPVPLQCENGELLPAVLSVLHDDGRVRFWTPATVHPSLH